MVANRFFIKCRKFSIKLPLNKKIPRKGGLDKVEYPKLPSFLFVFSFGLLPTPMRSQNFLQMI